MSGESVRADVVVIGAGMAGLVAAREIARAGLRVVVVEARERVGGRVRSASLDGQTVELGAEFIHGKAPELWALIEEFALQTVERDGAMLQESVAGGGEDDSEDNSEQDSDNEDGIFSSLEELAALEPDVSFAAWLATSGRSETERAELTNYVEGFNAAEAGRISARSLGVQQQAEEAIEGDRAWHVVGGYGQLAERLRVQLEGLGVAVRLGEAVRAVRWQPGEVAVETSVGEVAAKAVVVTLPLGVLERVNAAEGVRMQPELAAIAAARGMAMGDALHLTMQFSERWWEQVPQPKSLEGGAVEALHFLIARQREIPVWWTTHPERSPLLVGWAGGPKTLPLLALGAAELEALAVRELAAIFAVDESFVRERLVRSWSHDWTADPYSRGAYSYVAAGGIGASEAMAEPEGGTVFFAGEHTDLTGNWGTVHAAVGSGLRVAGQVVAAFQR